MSEGRVQHELKRPDSQPMAPPDLRKLSILITIVALVGENCDFDRLRVENATLQKDLDTISYVGEILSNYVCITKRAWLGPYH
jgi:hypothetical protein